MHSFPVQQGIDKGPGKVIDQAAAVHSRASWMCPSKLLTDRMKIDTHLLSSTAFSILTADLEGYGNVLGSMHRAALLELVDTFTGYCTGALSGRRAFGLPTGMGKTSALVSFITALHRLGYAAPVSVAASKVEALCKIKRDLVAHGVPASVIGLKHAVSGASEPSTGNESHLVQLVTHARIRSGRDFALFGTHHGVPRPLCVYDETLMRSDVFAFGELALRKALGVLRPEVEDRKDPLLGNLLAYLTECSEAIRTALDQLKVGGDPSDNGLPVDLPFRDEQVIESYRKALQLMGRSLGSFGTELQALLSVSQEPLQVILTEQGSGVVAVREAVPRELRNVVVLDASTPIRQLARLDPTVAPVESFEADQLKGFGAVEVRQIVSSGSRWAIERSYAHAQREAAAVSLEVADIIREGWQTENAFLVFTFIRRGDLDPLQRLRQDLVRAGINLDATTREGHARVAFLTWGQETSLNGFEYCTSVIMAGVLHRAHLDLAGAIKGQIGHAGEPTPNHRVREVLASEIAHVVYQGASRGSCRRVHDGKALPMRLHLIHKDKALRIILDRVMPGAKWSYPTPKHLPKAAADSRAAQLLARLLEYLRGLPEDTMRVSSKQVKAALEVGSDNATRQAFTSAGKLLDVGEHGWCAEGKSFVRAALAYGFEVVS
jgi:hypothetical protein